MGIIRFIFIAFLTFITFSSYALEDGKYTGTAEGYVDDIKVEINVNQGRITDVVVLEEDESKPMTAYDDVTTAIVLTQEWQVDAVSGATATSNALMLAAKAAMEKSGHKEKIIIPVTPERIAPAYEKKTKLEKIQLPPPEEDINVSLFQALHKRASTREYSNKSVPLQKLSNLLWAAHGFNRKDELKRTVPSARNWQEIDIYVATRRGVYVYDALNNELKKHLSLDIRNYTGVQQYTLEAPVNLIYVCDQSRMEGANDAAKHFYSAIDTGFIAQNVYLYCAAENMATISVGWVKKKKLAQILRLEEHQKVILCQMVGYPKEKN